MELAISTFPSDPGSRNYIEFEVQLAFLLVSLARILDMPT